MSLNIGGDNNGNIETHTEIKPLIMITKDRNLFKSATLLFIVTAVLLLVAPFVSGPYGYFTFLRLMVCASCGCLIWESRMNWLNWSAVILILLYNPIIPVHLERDVWALLNVITAVFLLIGHALNRRAEKKNEPKIGF